MPQEVNHFGLFAYNVGFSGYTFIGRLSEAEYKSLPNSQYFQHFTLFTAYGGFSSELYTPDELGWYINDNYDNITYNKATGLYEKF